jgi:hypothetical protein
MQANPAMKEQAAAASKKTGASSSPPLLEGLLDSISDLIGDGASLAAFRYAAIEEGRRIGAAFRPSETERLLERVDAVLGQRSTLVTTTPLRIRVEDSALLASSKEVVRGIALGLLEGALNASRGGRHKATLDRENGQVDIVLEVETHD